jgi:hypothetical protein
MRCGLRSKAAGVKSCRLGDIEVIIKKSPMSLQYESPGRDKLGWECFPRVSVIGCGEAVLPVRDQYKSVSVPVAVSEASGGAGIVNTGNRFHQDAEKLLQRLARLGQRLPVPNRIPPVTSSLAAALQAAILSILRGCSPLVQERAGH